jgi:hypothetical protein
MAESASRTPRFDEKIGENAASLDTPSLDPGAIERAYVRERARRRAKVEHREYARNSNARFWVMMAILTLITVVVALTALHEIQTSFGVFQ